MATTEGILAAIGAGAETSLQIAEGLKSSRAVVSVALCRLGRLGLIAPHGVVGIGRRGRPYVRWRLNRANPGFPICPESGRRVMPSRQGAEVATLQGD